MRIAHFIGTNFVGGPERQILNHIGRLPRDRCAVLLISFDEHGGQELRGESVRLGINCELLPAGKWQVRAALSQLLRLYDDWKPELVCAHGYKAGFYTLLLKLLRRCRYVGFSRGWTSENLKVRCYNLLDRLVIRFADVIVAVSNSQRLRLLRACVPANKIRVIENAVTVPQRTWDWEQSSQADIRQALGLSPTARIVLAAGRLSPEKGYGDLLRAMARVHEQVPDVHLLLAGTGPLESTLVAQAAELGLEEAVHFLGFRKDMLNLYGQADVFALSSLSEGLPNVVLEAMAMGLPVVATRVGALPEIIDNGRTGILVTPRATEELAAGIHRILTDRQFAHAAAASAREDIYVRFSPDTQTERLLAVYREATAQ